MAPPFEIPGYVPGSHCTSADEGGSLFTDLQFVNVICRTVADQKLKN